VTGEEVLESAALFRGVGVEREDGVVQRDVVFLGEPISTPGTEIAPGSDVIGEDFEGDWIGHVLKSVF
jgi:hypothetical protein